MSNPAVVFLSNIQINNIHFRIEDNLGESIHLHYGNFRISLSIEEFIKFADAVEESVEKILLFKMAPLAKLDKEALKPEWSSNYKKIQDVFETTMALDELYMKESYVNCRRIKRIIPLRESGYIKLLSGKNDDIEYYEQSGLYEPSRSEKAEAIKTIIMSEGYPFDNKKILVDQDGYILDGIKRASCLYYLFGGDTEISVIQIRLDSNTSIIEKIENAENEVKLFQSSKKDDEIQSRRDIVTTRYEYKDLIYYIQKTKIPFFVIQRNKQIKDGYRIKAEIILEKGKLDDFKEKILLEESQKYPYKNYMFLYSVKKPICFETLEGYVLVYEQICVKSKFYNQILPVDREFTQWLRKNILFDDAYKYWVINEQADLLIRILDCMLEKETFSEEDILCISSNIEFLKTNQVFHLLEKEFFSYTEQLLTYLQNQSYDEALRMYVANMDY